MPTLYVTEPGATVRVRSASLVVTDRSDDGGQTQLFEAEPHHVDAISLVGDVHITADALRRCFELGIPVSWLSLGGELLGRCVAASDRNGALRMAQYAAAADAARSLAIARAIVAAKARNARALLTDVQGNDPGNVVVRDAIASLRALDDTVLAQADLAALRGAEGAAAAAFYGAFGSALRPATGMVFTRRQRRPPPDPVNALLSFASVLLGNRIAGMVEARGLDPSVGFLHELRSGRPSLAVDLLEEWRAPVVERFVLRVCNLKAVRPEHFEAPDEDGGVRMNREGMRQFFVEWEKFVARPVRGLSGQDVALLDAIGRQVDAFASVVREGGVYEPFVAR
jgi:CRISP-associated protein Cas1